jgi:PAS domain S-box-containing protein/putative nucleotidyltransferase with HDIG domain
MTETKKLRILLLDDLPSDAELIQRELIRREINFISKQVKNKKDYSKALKDFNPDIILSDFNLASLDGMKALELAQETCPNVPFIFVSEAIGEDLAIETLKKGAKDYVLKEKLSRLVPVVNRAMEEFEEQARRKSAEERVAKLAHIPEDNPNPIVELTIDGSVIYMNAEAKQSFPSLKVKGTKHKFLRDFKSIAQKLKKEEKRFMSREIEVSGSIYEQKIIFTKKDNSVRIFAHDLTQKRQTEQKLQERDEEFDILFEEAPDAIYLNNLMGTLIDGNKRAEELIGYKREDLVGKNFLKLKLLEPDQIPRAAAALAKNVLGKATGPDEFTLVKRDGTRVIAEISTYPLKIKNKTVVMGIARDITVRKKAEKDLEESYIKLQKILSGTVQSIAKIVEMRDPYTSGHQRRVANLASAIAQEMGLSKDQVDSIRVAGVIHDIGKIAVPAEILSKPSQLTDSEMSIIKSHPQVGYDILKEIEFPWPIADIVHQHHERMAGDGYPIGLEGEKILIEARILAVADVVEAMSSHRPYRPALGMKSALEEIRVNRGFLYDPVVVDACLKIFDERWAWIVEEIDKPVFRSFNKEKLLENQ